MAQKVNYWELYKKVEGRSWDQLIQRLNEEIQVPCESVQFGFTSLGTPFAICKLDRPSTANTKGLQTDKPTEKVNNG